jgi:hypothetical protein
MTTQPGNTTPFRIETEIPPFRSLWIGVLQGSWKEIGTQYGERAGKDMARNFDSWWQENVLAERLEWQKGRSAEEKTLYCRAYFDRSLRELSCLSVEMVELFEAMGQGAGKELDRCAYGREIPHVLKIAMMNTPMSNLHPRWDFTLDRPMPPKGGPGPLPPADHDCNGFWAKGRATSTGETVATRSAQSMPTKPGGFGRERQVSYVAIPKDAKARVFWGNGRAGNLGGLGGGLLNDRGLCVLTSGAQSDDSNAQPDETLAPGIVDFWRASYGVIFSQSAREAAERVTVGTEAYHRLTGRKTIMRNRGCNIVFADANEALVVEQNARHYSIRKPGDLGETGSDYIVHANHFMGEKGSFDQENIYRDQDHMKHYCPEREGRSSYYRFWSGMWMLHHYYGKIDVETIMQEIVPSHDAYDRTGKRYPSDSETGAPALVGTWCTHEGGGTEAQPFGTMASIETSVFNLSRLEVRWIPVMPCHHKRWNLDWQYTNLTPYRDYRKMLWGY